MRDRLRRWWDACWRAVLHTVWTRTVVLERQVGTLEREVARLGELLKGVERTASPDGVPGWYFEGRVGVLTKFFLLQPTGHGAAFSCATAWDRYAAHCVNEAANVQERVGVVAQCISANPTGTNTGVVAYAAKSEHGNVAIDAKAGLSMAAPDKLTIIKSGRYE